MSTLASLQFHTIVIVGGGCYGTFYARQLLEASSRGKVGYQELCIVDRNPACQAAGALPPGAGWRVEWADWDAFFDRFLADSPARRGRPDLIVPSPLMPHLMYHWLLRRARARWPRREIGTRPLAEPLGTPYDRLSPDGTRYVSFAEWLCPTHCVEPAICPVIRAPRTWEMADSLAVLARRLSRDRRVAGPVLFHCQHQVHGVGAFPVESVLEGDARVAEAGSTGEAVDVLVATISSCHGAVNLLHLGATA
jgi:hypothetical protein